MDKKIMQNIIELAESGDLDALKDYVISLDIQIDQDAILYKKYIEKYSPTCKVCDSKIIFSNYNDLIFRNMDCASVDYTIGCCCCGSGPDYHKPECAVYFCSENCLEKYRILYRELMNEYIQKEFYNWSGRVLTENEKERLEQFQIIKKKVNDLQKTKYVEGYF